MEIKNLNLVNVPLEVLTDTIGDIVASELQKVIVLSTSSNKNENVDEILTRKQVCKLLKISNSTLFNCLEKKNSIMKLLIFYRSRYVVLKIEK